jgi:Cu+-exporting ATPase
LIRDAEVLETLEDIDTVVVDKTGTLTEGRPTLTECVPVEGMTEERLLQLAASLEQLSEHPLARAVVEAARSRDIPLEEIDGFESVTGQGVSGSVAGQRILVGNHALLSHHNIQRLDRLGAKVRELQAAGKTVMLVAVDDQLAGFLAVSDPIKSSTKGAVQALHDMGLRLIMLTGDHQGTAKRVADELRIDEFAAGVRPEDKHQRVNELRGQGRRVAMAGDGINDAPALAAADVGIAMGTGTDVAIQSSGVTLVKGDLRGITRAMQLSRLTMRNIRQNLFFAFVYNLLGVPIAAGVLYPISEHLLLSPMIAAAAMSFSSVSVVANALRLRHARLN